MLLIHVGSAVSRTRDSAVEDVSGGRDSAGCQNQPAKGVQEDQRYEKFTRISHSSIIHL